MLGEYKKKWGYIQKKMFYKYEKYEKDMKNIMYEKYEQSTKKKSEEYMCVEPFWSEGARENDLGAPFHYICGRRGRPPHAWDEPRG